MANRQFQQFQGTPLKGIVHLYGRVSVGGSGAVTFQAWDVNTKAYVAAGASGTQGIKSVARTGTGAWTITLQDSYVRLLSVVPTISNTTGALTAICMGVLTGGDVTNNTTPTIKVLFSSATGAAAADPASGDKVDLAITLQNSGAL